MVDFVKRFCRIIVPTSQYSQDVPSYLRTVVELEFSRLHSMHLKDCALDGPDKCFKKLQWCVDNTSREMPDMLLSTSRINRFVKMMLEQGRLVSKMSNACFRCTQSQEFSISRL